jgi:large subunit ribosomal protein L7Ae
MAKSYVKFEVSNEVASKTYEALQMARQSGPIRKGANEVTKSVERGLASFVVIATDVEPEEVVMHIPTLCEQKKVAFTYVPSKLELGKAIGMSVPCAAIAVENQGNASTAIKEIISKVTGTSSGSSKAQPAKAEQPSEKKPAKASAKPKAEQKPAEPVQQE